MSISSTVATLARSLADHLRAGTPDVALLTRLEQLAEMPAFVTTSRLDLWEESVLSLRDDKAQIASNPAYAAAVEILELGRINLYGEIDDELSDEYFARAHDALVALGIAVIPARDAVDLTDW
jgi:hypothetical protein